MKMVGKRGDLNFVQDYLTKLESPKSAMSLNQYTRFRHEFFQDYRKSIGEISDEV